MKKILLLCLMTLGVGTFVACSSDDNEPKYEEINYEALVEPSKNFVTDYFSTEEVFKVRKNFRPERNGALYKVLFKSAIEVEFNNSGEWVSVEHERDMALPTDFMPQNLVNYVEATYPNVGICSIEKEHAAYEVELTNGLELLFDLDGNFIRVDTDDDNEPKDVVIAYDKLPEASRNFVTTYFANEEVLTVEKKGRVEADGTLYELNFKSGIEIEFDAAGKWLTVDGENNMAIPTQFIPQKIVNYVSTAYPTEKIASIEKEATGFEVELVNNVDLIFDTIGKFIRVAR